MCHMNVLMISLLNHTLEIFVTDMSFEHSVEVETENSESYHTDTLSREKFR